jgi:hypothetical protein
MGRHAFSTDAQGGHVEGEPGVWQVDDIEREVAELNSRGTEFEDYDMPGERSPNGVG